MNINTTKRNLATALGIACIIAVFNLAGDEKPSSLVDEISSNNFKETQDSNVQSAVVGHVELDNSKSNDVVASDNLDESSNDADIYTRSQRITQFATSVSQGDDRSPPLVRQEPTDATPSDILEDEDKYLEYQALEKQKVMISYLKAAGPKMAFIREKIAEGKKRGIAEDRLEEAQRKLLKMEQMVMELHLEYPNLKEMIALNPR